MAILKRLSKVARELNVGISTIVEFLSSQNKEVSSNPNTKIGEELYMLLLQEFQTFIDIPHVRSNFAFPSWHIGFQIVL